MVVSVADGTRPTGEHAEVGRDLLLKELKLARLVVDSNGLLWLRDYRASEPIERVVSKNMIRCIENDNPYHLHRWDVLALDDFEGLSCDNHIWIISRINRRYSIGIRSPLSSVFLFHILHHTNENVDIRTIEKKTSSSLSYLISLTLSPWSLQISEDMRFIVVT